MKLFKGLFGVSSNGTLYWPNGKFLFWLPKKIAYKVHTLLNKFGMKVY